MFIGKIILQQLKHKYVSEFSGSLQKILAPHIKILRSYITKNNKPDFYKFNLFQ
jgi:hypothetical protein